MNRILPRLGLALALTVPLFAAGLPIASADSASQVTVNITNSGFNPMVVNVPVGGGVTFVNQDTNLHTATSGSAPLAFDTGGINPGQSASTGFGVAGTYNYTDAATCLNNNQANDPNFNCTNTYQVIVGGAPAAASPAPAASAPAAPASAAPAPASSAPPTAPTGAVEQNATVNLLDTGISPASVTIAVGGSVNFVDKGSNVHTATSTGGGNPLPFDTGGLGAGQNSSVGFGAAGTYTYTSSTDCLNGNSTPGFNCGPFSITVTNAPAAPAPAAPAPAASAPPATSAAAPATSQATTLTVNIMDNGYDPNAVSVKVGSTVTWVNKGTSVHTVTSNPGYIPTFDSGGLAPGQSFSYNFTTPGSFGYHSSTEPVYTTDTNTNVTSTVYSLNGTVNVQ